MARTGQPRGDRDTLKLPFAFSKPKSRVALRKSNLSTVFIPASPIVVLAPSPSGLPISAKPALNQPGPQEERHGERSLAPSTAIRNPKTTGAKTKVTSLNSAKQTRLPPPSHQNLAEDDPPSSLTLTRSPPDPTSFPEPKRHLGPHSSRFLTPNFGYCCGFSAYPLPEGLSRFRGRALGWAANMSQFDHFQTRYYETVSHPLPSGQWVYEIRRDSQTFTRGTTSSLFLEAQISTWFYGGDDLHAPSMISFGKGTEGIYSKLVRGLEQYPEELTIACSNEYYGHFRMGVRVFMSGKDFKEYGGYEDKIQFNGNIG